MRTWRHLVCLLLAATPAVWIGHAEHFNIALSVEGDGRKAEAQADDSPPPEGHRPRPVFRCHPGDSLTLQFLFEDANPHAHFDRITVRYYLDARRVGDRPPPRAVINEPVLHGEFVLDLKPEGKIGLRQRFQAPLPGHYCLRVESAQSGSDHEHFSAIDLNIE